MRNLFVAMLLTCAGAPATAIDGPPPPMPAWLAGAWQSGDSSNWTDEFWTPPRGGLMIGAGRSGKGERIDLFEHTRIVRLPDGALVFIAQPFGNPSVHFPLYAQGPQMIEFVNAEHDYPQRIRYWREGALLKARISLLDGSNSAEWSYSPMGAR